MVSGPGLEPDSWEPQSHVLPDKLTTEFLRNCRMIGWSGRARTYDGDFSQRINNPPPATNSATLQYKPDAESVDRLDALVFLPSYRRALPLPKIAR